MIALEQSAPYVAHPLALYARLEQPHTLLLESAHTESKAHTKSIILSRACLQLLCQGDRVHLSALTSNGKALLQKLSALLKTPLQDSTLQLHYPQTNTPQEEFSKLFTPSPLDALRALLGCAPPPPSHPLALFCAGLFSFEMVHYFENLPSLPALENSAPDYLFYVAETLIVIDHKACTTQILGACFDQNCQENLQADMRALAQLAQETRGDFTPHQYPHTNTLSTDCPDLEFEQRVLRLQAELQAGEIFQAVISRGFSLECLDSLSAYYHLKTRNPSPYMFMMRAQDFTLFGASPESALTYNAPTRTAQICPIAGTRARALDEHGHIDLDLDNRIELELLSDTKERAEHLMLVDLARNDLARVCSTRFVHKLLRVEKYSHVMHLTSALQGVLKSNLDALHAFRSFMNAGTLSGAPKVSALKLIAQLEGKRRGSYGGSLGYLCTDGSMDTCIVIRSAFVRDGRAFVQSGAGIVLESQPKAESAETKAKAQSVLEAIQKTYQ
ncbi:anthranilate synthase component I [Helicobacter baculiformis]|uniref:anthranilate synthase n=1 Tax=Helicobacter baculiformis TaxID=427351 RepID=A0ABV7ZFB7_9HELI|nr:anthranilate synthase component I [Helicobacter baculiformis]